MATYQMEQAPVQAMEWEEYEHIITTGWSALLSEILPPSERTMQAYLEKHPSLVPGAFSLSSGTSSYHPGLMALISQPLLPSYGGPIPDFMWLSNNSEVLEPVLIEIEAPAKRWFTQSGQPISQLTQALNQISEWKAWFNKPHNVMAFKDYYLRDQDGLDDHYFQPKYALIYGRRDEANARPELISKRATLSPDDVVTMTYDRLLPDPRAKRFVCIKIDRNRQRKVVSVPPTLQLGPVHASVHASMIGFEDAIIDSPHIPSDRQQFLIRRLAYWNEWARQGKLEFISVGDKE